MGPKAKGRLALAGIIVGGYLLVNGATFAVLALPSMGPGPLDSMLSRVFAVTLLLAIGLIILYYGIKYRRRSKAEIASTGS